MRYKAFLSYAHADEKWARWLHRALESYRMPRRLAASGGAAPSQLGTVFRDRDELVAGPALSEAIEAALVQSENLVVLCSPAAAASRWVNEEVRRFRELGRGDRIFCVIVDGTPELDANDACFPPALFEGVAEAEPLAVDVRPWADGKRLAKLKLLAALLGTRLEDLRNRDHQRRRKRQLTAGLAGALALLLILVTGSAVLSERRERQRSEDIAGTMATLGGDIKNVVDLETQRKMIDAVLDAYEGLDPRKLTPESATQVALILRQMGSVNRQQGRPEEALSYFRQSRELLEQLDQWHPDTANIVFELSQAHFFEGLVPFIADDFAAARGPAEAYEQVARRLSALVPDDLEYRMEHVWALQNLAILEMSTDASKARSAAQLIEEAVSTADTVMVATDRNDIVGHYSTLMSWLAEARTLSCEYSLAREAHDEAVRNAARASGAEPANNFLKRQLAYRYFGASSLELMAGNIEGARSLVEQADSVMQAMLITDPTNKALVSNINRHRMRLADIDVWTGRAEEGLSSYLALIETSKLDTSAEGEGEDRVPIELRLRAGLISGGLGRNEEARLWLASTFSGFSELLGERELDAKEIREFITARWAWKVYVEEPLESAFPEIAALGIRPNPESGDCRDVDVATRLAVIQGRRSVAVRHAEYLAERGYRHPMYLDFCHMEGLCES
ncbi:toll/interleukin-1 receptor domain-containing protein [Marinihelvus fidelis]|uniref:Toll/interleukin-1 receptor domain-containing protein n=1 Tax=Marinihelvus fidelis TaxID=2613842 RepID=A0A5N0T5Q8_9GAMM|nr:toll/interleukin-1 receptor domain-containing protein [Marinihelvus fidelis]KAA9129794.1 toll/interleukin-1 receptor domain-containing protein [Marinihelvus fidelis]